ncbi:MAG: hypothetical protein HQM08_28460 [Candidatus Riflebacteria bacterium]|nr:hypothetical protein [Candidatus Riflebacteria bacterium]
MVKSEEKDQDPQYEKLTWAEILNIGVSLFSSLKHFFLWFIFAPFLFFLSGYLLHRFFFMFPENSEWLQVLLSAFVTLMVFSFSFVFLKMVVSQGKDFSSATGVFATIKLQSLLYFIVDLGACTNFGMFDSISKFFPKTFFQSFFYFWAFCVFCFLWIKISRYIFFKPTSSRFIDNG